MPLVTSPNSCTPPIRKSKNMPSFVASTKRKTAFGMNATAELCVTNGVSREGNTAAMPHKSDNDRPGVGVKLDDVLCQVAL